jgi:membrane associated rhomboid family serine protease
MKLKLLRDAFRKFPFTVTMVLLVASVGLATATHLDRLEPALMKRFGFAPLHLPHGEFFRLVTSAFLTLGGWSFYQSLAMLAICVGVAEWRAGTWRTLVVFWGVHLSTLATLSFLFALPAFDREVLWRQLLAAEHDAGPSAGYYGCLGLLCQKQTPRRSRWLFCIVGGLLIVRLVWTAISPHPRASPLGADIAHLIAFPLGIVAGKLLRAK